MNDPQAVSAAIIHLHRVEQPAALQALEAVLREWKYVRREMARVPREGPGALASPLEGGPGQAAYLVGPGGPWLTILQGFQSREEAPFLADVSNRLSEKLRTHALALLLHEGAVLFYNLDYRGTPRDGYTSNPQFLAEGPLSEPEVQRQRHQPKAFTPLLPRETRMAELVELLDAGWWAAHDGKELDDQGQALDEENWLEEEERLVRLGRLLQLNGKAGYPFARWPATQLIDWRGFRAVYYVAKGRTLPLL